MAPQPSGASFAGCGISPRAAGGSASPHHYAPKAISAAPPALPFAASVPPSAAHQGNQQPNNNRRHQPRTAKSFSVAQGTEHREAASPLGQLPVAITSAMDAGNITADSVTDGRVELRINPDPFTSATDNTSHSQWFNFRASNVKGRRMTFAITNCAETSFPGAWAGYHTCASYDGETWFRVTSTEYDEASGTLEWTIAPEHATISFAYFAPYSYERHQALISRCMQHPAAELSVLGTTLDGRPLEMLTVGSGALQVWLIARQHPGESMAEFLAEGFLEGLLSDEAAQAAATFHVIPNMNPDGSIRGHLRTNAAGSNLNREWAPSTSSADGTVYEAPTLERSPEVYHVLAALDSLGCDLFLDVHGDEELPANFWAGIEGVPGVTKRNLDLYAEFQAAMLSCSPDFQTEKGYPEDEPGKANLAICSNQIAHRFGCVALTFEQPFKDCWNNPEPVHGWSPLRAAKLGESTLQAIKEVLPTIIANK